MARRKQFVLLLCVILGASCKGPQYPAVAVLTGPSTLRVDESVQLQVSVTAGNTPATPSAPSMTDTVMWESSNAGVVSVSARGLAKGISAGTATIKATPITGGSGTKTAGTLNLTVLP